MTPPKTKENFVANRLDSLLRIEKIKKIEAAHHQLRTACRLFFQDEDRISVHTLAWAAHEILEKNPKSAGSLLFDLAKKSPESKQAIKELTEARNFFKHYHNAPLKAFPFIENLNEWLLIDCGQMYRSITGKMIKEVCAVNAWVSVRRNLPILDNPTVVEYMRGLNLPKEIFLQTLLLRTEFIGPDFE